jgi:hypothetical protein
VAEQLRLADVGGLAMTIRDVDRDGMGLYTRDGTPKEAVDAVKRALQPMQAMLADPTSNKSDVVVINDLPKAFEFELHWETDDDSGDFEGTVDSDSRWRDGPVSIPADGTVSLSLHVGDHHIENNYER